MRDMVIVGKAGWHPALRVHGLLVECGQARRYICDAWMTGFNCTDDCIDSVTVNGQEEGCYIGGDEEFKYADYRPMRDVVPALTST